MIGLPPVDPWVNAIEREESPGVAESEAGTEGRVTGVVVTAVEAMPIPAELIAFTYTVYGVPFVRPPIVIGEVV